MKTGSMSFLTLKSKNPKAFLLSLIHNFHVFTDFISSNLQSSRILRITTIVLVLENTPRSGSPIRQL